MINMYTYRSLYLAPPSRQPRRTFDLAGSSRLVMPLDLPTFATDFELSSLASLPSFRKHYQLYRRYDFGMRCGGYRLYTIVRSIIGFTRGRGTFRSLSLLVLLLLLLLFSFTLGGRRCVIVARLSLYRTGLSTICCRGLIIGLKCLSIAMFSSILPVFRARFLRIDSLVFSISLAIFFTRVHINHVRLWQSID